MCMLSCDWTTTQATQAVDFDLILQNHRCRAHAPAVQPFSGTSRVLVQVTDRAVRRRTKVRSKAPPVCSRAGVADVGISAIDKGPTRHLHLLSQPPLRACSKGAPSRFGALSKLQPASNLLQNPGSFFDCLLQRNTNNTSSWELDT
jgi:hypothetical protein